MCKASLVWKNTTGPSNTFAMNWDQQRPFRLTVVAELTDTLEDKWEQNVQPGSKIMWNAFPE